MKNSLRSGTTIMGKRRRFHWWKCNHCGDVVPTRYDHPPRRKHKCGREDWRYDGFY
jgi:ribosomal protein L37E